METGKHEFKEVYLAHGQFLKFSVTQTVYAQFLMHAKYVHTALQCTEEISWK